MDKVFTLNSQDVATLLLLQIAVTDILMTGEVEPDILNELESLNPKLEDILYRAEEKPLTA